MLRIVVLGSYLYVCAFLDAHDQTRADEKRKVEGGVVGEIFAAFQKESPIFGGG